MPWKSEPVTRPRSRWLPSHPPLLLPSVVNASIPLVDPVTKTITWRNTAAYCLSKGLLHGRAHWRKQFTRVASVSGVDFLRLGSVFIQTANGSAAVAGRADTPGEVSTVASQYGLATYSLAQASNASGGVIFHDVTCSTGAMAVLGWLEEHTGASFASPAASGNVSTSHLAILAGALVPIDPRNGTAMGAVAAFYQRMSDVVR